MALWLAACQPLLPVRVALRDFAAFAPLASVARGSACLLFGIPAATLAEAQCADALEPLRSRVE